MGELISKVVLVLAVLGTLTGYIERAPLLGLERIIKLHTIL